MIFSGMMADPGFLGTPKTLSGMFGFQRLQRNVIALDVKKLGPCPFFRFSCRHLLSGNEVCNLAPRIIQISGNDGFCGTYGDTRRLYSIIDFVRAVVAFGRGMVFRIDVDRIVGAGLCA